MVRLEIQCRRNNLIINSSLHGFGIVSQSKKLLFRVPLVLLEWAFAGAHSAGPIGASRTLSAWALNRSP